MTVLHPAHRLALLVGCVGLLTAPFALSAAPERIVEQAAREQLDARMAAAGLADARYELTVVSARAAPPCAKPVQVEAIDVRQPARMRFSARCPDTAGRAHEYVVRAKISAPVLVTAAPVASGEVLTDAHVTLEPRDITNAADALAAPEAAVGQTTRRSLRAGELLRASFLTAPLLVKRGDAVVMIARMEGIEVTTAGQALDAGARGALVRVKNAASGQIVRMRVTAPGTVEPVEIARISP